MSQAEQEALLGQSLAEQDDNDAAAASGASIVAAAIVAAILALFAALVFVQQKRSGSMGAKDDVDSEFDVRPKSVQTAFADDSAIGQLAHFQTGALPTAMLTERGDKLWTDYRRCASFDHLYYGNAPFQLSDTETEDVYGVLAVACPPRSYFEPLRQVGNSFLDQMVGKEGGALTDVSTIDDMVEFLSAGMADALVERALDLCATLKSAGGEYQNEELYEVFYAMIGEYDPDQNAFLTQGENGRGLRVDAADRVLDHKEPIYWEVMQEEADEEYSAITGALEDEAMYDEGSASGGAHAIYDHANPGAGGAEATYAMADSVGAGGGEALYAMANSLSGDIPRGEATYAIASAVTARAGGGEATYAMADNSVGARAGGGEATYAMADNSVGARAGGGGEATYAIANSVGLGGGGGSAAEATYAMADSAGVGAGYNAAGAGGPGGIYDIAATSAAPSRHSHRRSSMGAEPTYGFASSIPLSGDNGSKAVDYALGSTPDAGGSVDYRAPSSADEGIYGRASAHEMPNAYAKARASVASSEILYDTGSSPGSEATTEMVFDTAPVESTDGSIKRRKSSLHIMRADSGRSNSYLEACETATADDADTDAGVKKPFAKSKMGSSSHSIGAMRAYSERSMKSTGSVDSFDMAALENDADFLAFEADYNEMGLDVSTASLPRHRVPGAAKAETSLLMQNIAGLDDADEDEEEDDSVDAEPLSFQLAPADSLAPKGSLRLESRGISNENLEA